jgi:hypothetical protein
MTMHQSRKVRSTLKRAAVAALAVATIGVGAQAAGATNVSQLQNGGFEQPTVPAGTFRTYSAGSVLGTCHTGIAYPGGPALRCWKVTNRSVDIVERGYWAPFTERQSVDLNSNELAATIQQTFKPGTSRNYVFRAYAAMNPDVVNGYSSLKMRVVQRDGFGQVVATKQQVFGVSSVGRTRQNMGYSLKELPFSTTSRTTNVSVELSGGEDVLSYSWGGPVVDSVSVVAT